MTTARLVLAVVLIAQLLLPEGGRAGDGLSFFEDDHLSFERPQRAEAPRAVESASQATRTGPPSRAAEPSPRAAPKPVEPRPAGAGEVRTAKSLAGPAAPPAKKPATQSALSPRYTVGGSMQVEILDVREPTPEEQGWWKGKMKCRDPLVATIRADATLRVAVATAARISPSRLPDPLLWIFGRSGNCFDMRNIPNASLLAELSDAARKAFLLRGGR